MHRVALSLIAGLAVAPVSAQVPTETEQRTVVLAYRQALRPSGDRIAAVAGILAARVNFPEGADIAQIRDQLLDRLQPHDGYLWPPSAEAPSDAVAARVLLEAARLPIPSNRLVPTWEAMRARDYLGALGGEILAQAAAHSGEIWMQVLSGIADDPALEQALTPLVESLAGAPVSAPIAAWRGQEPALPASALEPVGAALWNPAMARETQAALSNPESMTPARAAAWRARAWLQHKHRPPDPDREAIDRLRLLLYEQMPAFVNGNPLPFMAALVDGTLGLAMHQELSKEVKRDLRLLLGALETLPMRYDAQWRELDTRLPEIYAETIDRLTRMARAETTKTPVRAIAALQARLSLLETDWDAYLAQPFREPVQQAIEDCFSPDPDDPAKCRTRLREWALEGAAIPESAGDLNGPFDTEYLLREFELNPWQRINYLRGYWRDLLGQSCSGQTRVVNALEWSLGALAYLALLPESADTREQIGGDLDALISAGIAVAEELSQFSACSIEQQPLLLRVLGVYREALHSLSLALPAAAEAFRVRALVPGADISLDGGADQRTGYVPRQLELLPCEEEASSCGVTLSLPGSSDLFHRFPAPFRVAHQAGMGTLSMCYSDVSWVDRRVQPRRVGGGEVMADYKGRLSFRVQGRYSEGGDVRDVFVLRYVTDAEYTYLYAPNRPEVLADPCPREFQGQQAFGSLPESRGWLVPRRLTFLSSERTSPARLFTEHWARGENWLEALAGNAGVAVEKFPEVPAELRARLDLHLTMLRNQRRQELFELLSPPARPLTGTDAASRLSRAAQSVAAARRVLDATGRALLPNRLALTPALRRSLYGAEPLAGPAMVSEWRRAGRDPLDLPRVGMERLSRHAPAWREAGGVHELPRFLANALSALVTTRAHRVPATRDESGSDAGKAPSP